MEQTRKTNWADVVFWALLLIFVVFMIIKNGNKPSSNVSITYDTIPVYDTVSYPIARDSMILKYKTVKFPVADTIQDTNHISIVDSAEVIVPISQKVYEDSLYRIVVSGYDVTLDTVFVKSRIIQETIYKTDTKYKNKRFGLGVSAGYDPFNKRVGFVIGLQYNILPIK